MQPVFGTDLVRAFLALIDERFGHLRASTLPPMSVSKLMFARSEAP